MTHAPKPDERRQFAENYRNPDGGPLQIWPRLTRKDFEKEEDFWAWLDEIQRFNGGSRPRRFDRRLARLDPTVPAPDAGRPERTKRSTARQVGIRLSSADYGLLAELADAHAVTPSTMARILVTRGVRAAV